MRLQSTKGKVHDGLGAETDDIQIVASQLGFHSMQIENDAHGKPVLRFLEAAEALVERLQIRNSLVSLSDEKHYVVAMAVLES